MYTLNQVTGSIADINTAGMRKGGKAEGGVEPIMTIEQASAVSFGDAEFFFFGFRAIALIGVRNTWYRLKKSHPTSAPP